MIQFPVLNPLLPMTLATLIAKKPFYGISIVECGEPLQSLEADEFALLVPHPYQAIGAPYGDKSPFYLRQGVRDRLRQAQIALQHQQLGWQIQIFDAYRPIAVQQYMVDYTFQQVAQEQGLDPQQLTDIQRQAIWTIVHEFWAIPSTDPRTPPPHSTGAAIDVTLVNAEGNPVDMGSAIDELSPRSYPNHFATSADPTEQLAHRHRLILRQSMVSAGFQPHPREWWHFSYGDQLWAWLTNGEQQQPAIACYGAAQQLLSSQRTC